ncbi:cupredoxin family copper-binding protein [Actinomadura barringtoniae]|uniref:Cupredoxin family copper-binding protein n=1 Tax=Actinomadura barringtoniae TaxID=1427535 RepID=A0A939PN51_9ACTN|nr:cupredoxin family copper-binding protein [Actinomadura barringtoniae]MBO2452969.1 cupredoxin family copper-binding protein [Actinomadura barringtoniae]
MRQPPAEVLDPPVNPRRRLVLLVCAALAVALAMLSLIGLSGGHRAAAIGPNRSVAASGGLTPADPRLAAPVAYPNAQAAAAAVVHMKGNAFAPTTLTVAAGQKVTWINDDAVPHTVTTTSGPKKIDSGEIKAGASFSYTFTTPGAYAYYCAYHPDMKAGVTVTGGAPAPTPTPTGMPTGMPTGTPTASPTGHPMPPSPTPSPTQTGGPGTPSQCTGALNEILTVILQHVYTAHLQRSVSEQVADALALDSYLKTHLAWVQMILQSGVTEVQSLLKGLQPLLQHLYAAHLQRSPAQQVQDALAVDSYLKSHLVLVQDILKPGLDGLLGGGSC